MQNPAPLSPAETRVLGVLVEKEKTVPDAYPLSLNALVTGCNQKTSRDPVMDLSESEVLSILERLREGVWIVESSGSRVSRYGHNMGRVLGIGGPSVCLLATLMLRGPQTAAELRANAERLYRFPDISALEAYLDELANRASGALVKLLPRAPGAREARWAHLLCGEPPAVPASAVAQSRSTPQNEELTSRVVALEVEVERLGKLVTRLCGELGVEE